MSDSSEAIIEFIKVYGIAIIIIIGLLGALWHFGVINPQTFTGEKVLDQSCCSGICQTLADKTGKWMMCLDYYDNVAVCGDASKPIFEDKKSEIGVRYHVNVKDIEQCNIHWVMANQTAQGVIIPQDANIKIEDIEIDR